MPNKITTTTTVDSFASKQLSTLEGRLPFMFSFFESVRIKPIPTNNLHIAQSQEYCTHEYKKLQIMRRWVAA